MTFRCPICGSTRDRVADEFRKELQEHGYSGELADPGGRVIFFRPAFGGRREIRISDCCLDCDEKMIREAWKEWPK